MKATTVAAVLLVCVIAASAEVFFEETFGPDWEDRWVQSNYKKSEGTAGKFKRTAGKWYGDANHKGTPAKRTRAWSWFGGWLGMQAGG